MKTTAVDWESRAAALAHGLVSEGVLKDTAWVDAFTQVPRHAFVPHVLLGDGASMQTGDLGWLDLVYSDETLLTQTISAGEGISRHEIPTSSSSRPRVMAVMLDRLTAHAGHRALEIGTGTGYNTALLGHRLGADNVYSIDIDANLIDAAREHLAEIDQHPRLAVGDGTSGWAEHGPFDRIIATCAITQIPPAWIEQLIVGGRIVAPLDAGEAGPLLVLDKTAPDEVTGRIDPYQVHFMPLRPRADSPLGHGQSTAFTGTGMPHYGTTTLDPTLITAGGTDLALWLWLHAPGLRIATAHQQGRMYVHTATSLAQTSLVPDTDGMWPVQQRGVARLWDTIEHGYTTWTTLGSPGPDRLGVTATTDQQFVWLDDPDGTHSWPLEMR